MVRTFNPLAPGVLGQGQTDDYGSEPQEGTVLAVTAVGVTFRLPSAPGHSWGPAPWSLGQYATAEAAITAGHRPLVGDRLLVVFVGDDHIPWVAAWFR